jgi:hypothetical protein
MQLVVLNRECVIWGMHYSSKGALSGIGSEKMVRVVKEEMHFYSLGLNVVTAAITDVVSAKSSSRTSAFPFPVS